MKTLLLLLLVSTLAPLLNAETVVLRGRSYPDLKKTEGIMIWIRDDRSLLADFGRTTVTKLINTCKDWRKQGTEPRIRILLYPILLSNKDLSSILELIKNLDENKVPFDIMIMSEEAAPEDLFVTQK